jgi:hypothetical protein
MLYKQPRELLETLYIHKGYNVTGNGERECLKTLCLRQSAAMSLRNKVRVQRLFLLEVGRL